MKRTLFLTAIAAICSTALFSQTKEDAIRKTSNERYELAESELSGLLAKDPTNAEILHAIGDNYLYWGELDKAEEAYQRGITNAPVSPLNYAGLGRVAWMKGNKVVQTAQFEKAIEIMNTRSNKVPKHIQQMCYLKMAETLLSKEPRELPKALEYINQALLISDTNPEVYIQLGDYYGYRDGINLTNAMMQYNKAIELDPKNTRTYLRKGTRYRSMDNWDEALVYYNQAIEIDPTFAPAYREKAELLYAAGRTKQAIEAYEKYMELNSNCRVQQRFGIFIYSASDYARAIPELEKGIACNPDNAVLYRLLSYSQYETGAFDQSRTNLDKFFEVQAKTGKPNILGKDFGYKARLQMKAGQDSLALITYQEALTKDSSFVDLYSELATYYYSKKNYAKAAENYELITKFKPKNDPLDFYYLGKARYFNKEYQLADVAFAKSSEAYPDGDFWRGKSNNKMELSEDAPVGLGKPHFEKFISVCIKDQKSMDANKKNLIEAYSYLGYLYFVQKNFDCSKAAWNKVMELDANNEKAKTALGDKEIGGAAGICDLLPVAATK
jgi:tetratricopeptide (TPR) repeat protein